MAAPKRNGLQRENDYERIAAYYLKGWSQRAIADELGLSQQQISKDIAVVRERWQISGTINLDEAKQKELTRIDLLEFEFWAAWERSKKEGAKASQEKNLTGITVKSTMSKENRDGNPAFLAGVMTCIDRRCKLLGLDAATRNEISGPGGGPIETKQDLSSLTIDELLQLKSLVSKANANPDA